ncbi:MAG: phosphoserine phosphatase SerB [Alphaproteobacteria bacterium]
MPLEDTLHVVTLIAAAPRRGFVQFAQDCVANLARNGFIADKIIALHAEQAYDLVVRGASAHDLRLLIAGFAKGQKIDVIVQAPQPRRKKFLLADMESTMIQQEMLEEMADAIDARAHVTEVTRRAMNGEIDFSDALRQRVALFSGQPESLLATMALRMTPMPGAHVLVATMRKHGASCWLASGGLRYFTQRVAVLLGFDKNMANELLLENNRLTGKVAEPILDKNSKLQILRRGLDELGLTAEASIVVGDGANDLDMINASTSGAGLGIAFHAKPSVEERATHIINYADLTALLYAQGYRREEFVDVD